MLLRPEAGLPGSGAESGEVCVSSRASETPSSDPVREHPGGRRALTVDLVRDARRQVRNGASVDHLARLIGVSSRALSKAVYGVTWRRVDDPPPISRPQPADPDQPSPTVLNEDHVRRLRREHAGGTSVRYLATRCGLPYNTVHDAIRGVTWAHVDDQAAKECAGELRRPGVLLTAAVVGEMRRAHADGTSLRSLADKFHLEYATVRAAVQGTTWRHLTDPPPVPAAGRGGRNALTSEQEGDLVRMREQTGATYAQLGAAFGVSEATAWHVCNRGRSALG
jgi:lambda repressor-like predicted transcriptional regulator